MKLTPQPPLEMLEASLQRLSSRLPEAPVASIMLTRLLLQVGRGMSDLLERQIRPAGLAEAEFRVLTTLYSQPQGVAHPGDLCTRTSQRPANMSRICDSLVSRNLITRVACARDRRRMVLRITEQGEDLVQRLLPRMFARLRVLYSEIPEAEQRQLIVHLNELGLRLDAAMAELGAQPPNAHKPQPERDA